MYINTKMTKFLILLFILSSSTLTNAQEIPPDCIHTYERFAYGGIRDISEPLQLPTDSWDLVNNIFSTSQQNYNILNIELTRYNEGELEIWLQASVEDEVVWVVYMPYSTVTNIIPREVEGTDNIVSELFIDNQNNLWGVVVPNAITQANNNFIFSIFNETTTRFELIEDVSETNITSSNIQILQDNEIFWVLAGNDGVYSFDTITRITEKKADLTDIEPIFATISQQRIIYFSNRSPNPAEPEYASLTQEVIYEFRPVTNELTQISIPTEWPTYNGLLYDSVGRLWLGAIGFRDVSGEWNLLYPNSDLFFEYPLTVSRTLPTLLFESSDGRLWYTNNWDGGIWYNGTAWYDPITQEGCMFTNTASTITEDMDAQIWLVANGGLYKHTD